MPKLSIIVPVYNVGKYLPTCLDSILSQTFSDFEVICVDDGSNDGSSDILDEYAVRDDRIKVIHKANAGYGHSMNVGLDIAKGEYIGIVESDDYISPSFYENLFGLADKIDLDIVKGECNFVWETDNFAYRYHIGSLEQYYNTVIFPERLYLRCRFLMNIWSGIYKRDFIIGKGIRFNESAGASYQDNGFWLQCMVFAERIMFVDEAGYNYRQDNSSASVKAVDKLYTMLQEYDWITDRLSGKISDQQMNVINAYRLIRGYWSFLRIDDSKKTELCNALVAEYSKFGSVFATNLTWQEKYYPMISDPEGFCDCFIREKKEIVQKILDADSLLIYGAGNRGQRLLGLLCDLGWAGKIQCYIETNTPRKTKIGNVPVFCLENDEINLNNSLVIISAEDHTGTADEMRTNCTKRGLTNLIGSDYIFKHYPVLI